MNLLPTKLIMMPNKLHRFYLTLLIFLVSAFPIYAKGILDQTFGNGGIVVTNLGSEASVAGLKQQNDGKIVVLGKHDGFYIVLRYNTNGSLDNTFGTNGKVITSYAASDAKVNFNIQTDGVIAVGNNSSVSRYTNVGVLNATVNFPQAEFSAFGSDGQIATASLIPANGTCTTQTSKIDYILYNPSGSLVGSNQLCSGGIGTTGVISIWGIVSSSSNSFFVGYTHRAASASNGRVASMSGTQRVNDYSADIGLVGHNLVDLSANVSNGFVSIAYLQFCRLLSSYQCKNMLANPPTSPVYTKVHGNNKTAFLKNNSKLTVWNESSVFQGNENLTPVFGSATVQSSVYVQSDDKIIVAGQTVSGGAYKSIGLVRYSSVIGVSSPTAQFDQDAKADISVWRPSSGDWYLQKSSDNSFGSVRFGASSDKPVPADFDGDGETDIGVFRPSNGTWYWFDSSTNTFNSFNFGTTGDIPRPFDYDGDGTADIITYRPSSGTWFISRRAAPMSFTAVRFGTAEDIPLIVDFDGDENFNIAVWRPSNGTWYWLNNNTFQSFNWGTSEDKPVPADYDGDGKTDIAVYRPSNGTWYISGSIGVQNTSTFGLSSDKPVPADYDGDGKTDIAVYRPSNGTWYILGSSEGFTAYNFGISEDIPIPNAFIR